MSLDLNAPGPKVIEGTGSGQSAADPLRQTIQINQANVGNIPVTEPNLESATGTINDSPWSGIGIGSLVALLKAIALRWGVGGTVADGSGLINTANQSQPLFSGIAPVNGYMVQNNSSGVLWVNDIGAASAGGSSIQLNPNVMWLTPPGYKPPGVVSIYGGTSGQAFAARHW